MDRSATRGSKLDRGYLASHKNKIVPLSSFFGASLLHLDFLVLLMGPFLHACSETYLNRYFCKTTKFGPVVLDFKLPLSSLDFGHVRSIKMNEPIEQFECALFALDRSIVSLVQTGLYLFKK